MTDFNSETKRDFIVQQLRRRILSGEYARGARLRQDQLAADFGVSITPIREALRVLESERLVEAEPHRGVRVAEIDLDRIEGIYVVRRLVESYAMRRAVHRLSRHDFGVLRRMLDEMSQSTTPEAQRDMNRAFHFYFYDRCGLPELTQQIGNLWDSFPWDLLLDSEDRADASRQEHERVLIAAESGDADAAAAALGTHVANGIAAVRLHLTGDRGRDVFDED